jgi:hypothetical protein
MYSYRLGHKDIADPYYIAMIAADEHGFRRQRRDSYQISELELRFLKLVDV